VKTLETLCQTVTDGVADWLSQLVEKMPDVAPERANPQVADPAAAGWLQQFMHEVVTANPVTRDALASVQVFLIESALDCVDWDALARDPRFRHLDWSHARLMTAQWT
jgi:hypothetical protein